MKRLLGRQTTYIAQVFEKDGKSSDEWSRNNGKWKGKWCFLVVRTVALCKETVNSRREYCQLESDQEKDDYELGRRGKLFMSTHWTATNVNMVSRIKRTRDV